MKKKNAKKWWQYFLAVLLNLVIDVIILAAALILDSRLFTGAAGEGHGVPALTIIAAVILAAVTIILTVKNVILGFKALFTKSKNQASAGSESTQAEMPSGFGRKYFIAIPIQIVLSIVILFFSFRHEINTFYADPNHIGFAIPIVSFMLAFFLLIVTIFVIVICIILARRSSGK